MPIIKSRKKLIEGLADVEFSEEHIKSTHVENVTPIFSANHKERESFGNGWTGDRNMRRIARIPVLVAVEAEKNHPGFLRDEYMMRKFLQTDTGKLCMTVKKGV